MTISSISRQAVPKVKVDVIDQPIQGGPNARRLGIAAMVDDKFIRSTHSQFDGLEKLRAVLPDANGKFDPSKCIELTFNRTVNVGVRDPNAPYVYGAPAPLVKVDDHEIYLNADDPKIDLDAVRKFGVQLLIETNVGTFSPPERFK